MQKFKLVFNAETAEYDEVVDTTVDSLLVAIIIEGRLGDGFQWRDVLGVIEAEPLVNEVIDDAPIFWEQFQKLKPATAVAAVIEARNRILATGKTFGKVSNFVIRLLYTSATSYQVALDTYAAGQAQVMLFQNLFNGGPIFPDEMLPAGV